MNIILQILTCINVDLQATIRTISFNSMANIHCTLAMYLIYLNEKKISLIGFKKLPTNRLVVFRNFSKHLQNNTFCLKIWKIFLWQRRRNFRKRTPVETGSSTFWKYYRSKNESRHDSKILLFIIIIIYVFMETGCVYVIIHLMKSHKRCVQYINLAGFSLNEINGMQINFYSFPNLCTSTNYINSILTECTGTLCSTVNVYVKTTRITDK